ncbi:MAG: hypothetical protein HIU81_02325 [Acidobacteria bacterium]|nr:hypothetical protein [Acidobacteriota bacterium]
MSGGLYLGGVSLPYMSSLRAYIPAYNLTGSEMQYIDEALVADADRLTVDASELLGSLSRMARANGDPMPTIAAEHVRTFQWDDNSPVLYCPNQLLLRTYNAAGKFSTRRNTRQLSSLIIDQEFLVAAFTRREKDPRTSQMPLTRTANWGIPLSWLAAFHEKDRMEVVRSGDSILTVRLHTTQPRALERLKMCKDVIEEFSDDMFEDFDILYDWMAIVPAASVLELDYGPIAARTYPDDSPMDLRMGIEALAEGDMTSAAAAYRRLTSRWLPIRQLAHTS